MDKMITGVGTLPFQKPEDAISYVMKHDIPFMPELTKHNEAMENYLKNPEPLSAAKLFSENKLEIAKMQCVGVVTAMNFGFDEDEATLRIIDHISRHLKFIDAKKIILFLDEPVLGYSGLPFERMWENVFEEFDVIRGIHTCGNMLWDKLLSSPIEIINFDASQYDITRYYESRTKRIAWGVKEEGDIKDWHQNDLITAPCGLSQYNEDECEEIFNNLQNIKKAILNENSRNSR